MFMCNTVNIFYGSLLKKNRQVYGNYIPTTNGISSQMHNKCLKSMYNLDLSYKRVSRARSFLTHCYLTFA